MKSLNQAVIRIGIKKGNWRRAFSRWMVAVLALWPFLMNWMQTIPGMPGVVKYIADVVIVCMIMGVVLNGKFVFHRCILPLISLSGIFLVYTLIVYLFRYQTILYYAWGIRNNFRFIVSFYAFVTMVDEQDANKWFELMDVFYWINLIMAVIQFFYLRTIGHQLRYLQQDLLGGIFCLTRSANGYMLIFLMIVLIRSILRVYQNEIKMKEFVFKCIAAVLIAAMAEMKFFFLLLVFMLLLATLVTRFTWKKAIILIICPLILWVGAQLLVQWFGFENFLSWEFIWETATKKNYSSQKDVNRLSAIGTISKNIMEGPLDRLFGLGLGNCDTAAYSFLNTPFYQKYSYLNYVWFNAPMLFLETGYVGLAMYLSFFIFCFFLSHRQMKSANSNELFCRIAMIMSLLCIIIAFYNISLRIEIAYIIYFVLALPFMKQGETENIISGREIGKQNYR